MQVLVSYTLHSFLVPDDEMKWDNGSLSTYAVSSYFNIFVQEVESRRRTSKPNLKIFQICHHWLVLLCSEQVARQVYLHPTTDLSSNLARKIVRCKVATKLPLSFSQTCSIIFNKSTAPSAIAFQSPNSNAIKHSCFFRTPSWLQFLEATSKWNKFQTKETEKLLL